MGMLEEQIKKDMVAAMKKGEAETLTAIRLLLAEIKNKKIENLSKEIDDPGVISLVNKLVKQGKDSIDQFNAGNRPDLSAREKTHIEVLSVYLPKPLSEEELSKIVDDTIKELGAVSQKDMGRVMKEVMRKVSGKADGKVISGLVSKKIS
ncbi:MAG: GatB/YqeY domain-containing protein [Candidatus Omnitrophica bacterium]|nr:GatB/YqeY domain-containing protein [Candidatus Omnitrophota bacterium]